MVRMGGYIGEGIECQFKDLGSKNHVVFEQGYDMLQEVFLKGLIMRSKCREP